MAETKVGVRELKSRLSEYLRHVKSGRTIVITEHGKTVGRIIPSKLSLKERMAELQRAGIVTWTGKKLEPSRPVAKTRGPKTVAELLIEDRE